MIRCITSNVGDTRSVAAKLAGIIAEGDLVALFGGLGAGKTTFTQGFAVALDIDERVTSPTFALANRYQGRMVLNHLDAYRMGGAGESRDLGLDELLDDGVTLIEWADVILPALPADRLDIRIDFGESDDDRLLDFVARGTTWTERMDELATGLETWSVESRESPC